MFSKVVKSEWAIIGYGVVTCLISLFVSLWTDDGQWFERSGSVLVLFAVTLEFQQTRRMAKRQQSDISVAATLGLPFTTNNLREKRFHKIAIIMAISGTLIWGYGSVFWGS